MYQFKQLKTAVLIIELYKGTGPFHTFLKKYFIENKKHGSSDRKAITHLCYGFFRLGKAFNEKTIEEKILMGLLLSHQDDSKLLAVLKPEWAGLLNQPLQVKKQQIGLNSESAIFPYCGALSEGINCSLLNDSFFMQPQLFIRLRPGYQEVVEKKLKDAAINFSKVSEASYALPSSTKLDTILEVGKEVIIQDFNSQMVGEFIRTVLESDNWELTVWDCCAASGGKSIMAFDLNRNIKLTVSDIRTSILENLNDRFKKAGIKNYTSFVADLTTDELSVRSLKTGNDKNKYDIIMADVPCTGSGTWARSPENLYYFNLQQIDKYVSLQRKIIDNTVEYVSSKGYFLYSTCSIFRKENEEMVEYILKRHKLKLVRSEVLKGYEIKADSMFAALFIAS